jgi:septal ring factor EnvC (AmiA/AmiB activator)
MLLAFPIFGASQTKADLEKQKESTARELEIARELLNKTQNQKTSTINRVAILNRGIESREDMIRTIGRELDLLEREIDQLESEIRKIENTIAQGKEEYAYIIYTVYKNHTEEEKLMYLLASESVNQFYQRVKYMKYLKEYREDKILELNEMSVRMETRSQELMLVKKEKSALLTAKEIENRQLIRERSQRNGLIRKLAQDEKRIRREIQEKERIRKELEDKIRKIIEEEARKTSSNTLFSSLTPEQKLVGNNFLTNKGRLPWPVERGVITAKFGIVDHPVLSGVKISNNGIDISSNSGAKARAVYDGEVTSIFAILGANYAVIVMHGEYLSVYQNLVELKVKVGDKVQAKQELGTIHSEPDEDMAILHLQIWKSKDILNPDEWLSK